MSLLSWSIFLATCFTFFEETGTVKFHPRSCDYVFTQPENETPNYKGIFECFFGGFTTFLVASDFNARMIRKRVLRGSITSSI